MGGEYLAINMIKETNFSKFFFDSSQMMRKLGKNIRWVEILRNFKKNLMTSSLIRKYDVIIVILMSRQLKKWKSSLILCFWMD